MHLSSAHMAFLPVAVSIRRTNCKLALLPSRSGSPVRFATRLSTRRAADCTTCHSMSAGASSARWRTNPSSVVHVNGLSIDHPSLCPDIRAAPTGPRTCFHVCGRWSEETTWVHMSTSCLVVNARESRLQVAAHSSMHHRTIGSADALPSKSRSLSCNATSRDLPCACGTLPAPAVRRRLSNCASERPIALAP